MSPIDWLPVVIVALLIIAALIWSIWDERKDLIDPPRHKRENEP